MIFGGTEHSDTYISLSGPFTIQTFVGSKDIVQVEQEIGIQFIILDILPVAVFRVNTLTVPIFLYRINALYPVIVLCINSRRTAVPAFQPRTGKIQADSEVRMKPLTYRNAETGLQTIPERQRGIVRPHEHAAGKICLNVKVTPERRGITGFIIHMNSIHLYGLVNLLVLSLQSGESAQNRDHYRCYYLFHIT